MTGYAEFISIWVPEVRAIVMLVVLGPQARSTFRRASVRQGGSESPVDDSAVFREEGYHLAVARLVRLVVVGPSDQKQRPRAWRGLPARPGAIMLAEAALNAENGHQRVIEGQSPIEIGDAYEDMGVHAGLSKEGEQL